MPDSIREQILQALVVVYGGAEIVSRVPVSLHIAELEKNGGVITALVEGDYETTFKQYGSNYYSTCTVNIERAGAIESPPENHLALAEARSKLANRFLAELQSSIPVNDITLGGLCEDVIDQRGGVRHPERETSRVAAAFIEINCPYETVRSQPDVLFSA